MTPTDRGSGLLGEGGDPHCSSVAHGTHMFSHAGVMPSSRKAAKADIPDIHEETVEELREAFDLFDTKGAGTCSGKQQCSGGTFEVVWWFFVDLGFIRRAGIHHTHGIFGVSEHVPHAHT